MEQHLKLLAESGRVLARVHKEFLAPPTSDAAAEFHQLRLQAAIFNYDVCRAFVGLWVMVPEGFSEKVALKDLAHKLYEYDAALSGRLVGRILKLAKLRGITMDQSQLRVEKQKWKAELSKLRAWSALRNQTSGHYGHDIRGQASLLEALNRDDVKSVAIGFMSFNNFVCKLLAKTGARRNGP